jgi:transposase-like protein
MAEKKRPPLWKCAKCGRAFANRNQSHACGVHTLAHHFAGKPPEIRALYEAVVAVVKSVGPVRVLFTAQSSARVSHYASR